MIQVTQEDHRKIERFNLLLKNYQKAMVKIVRLENENATLTDQLHLLITKKRGL